ncbi:MAG: methionine--tRNA ligase [Flammeovirgaceae bacterium]
MSFIKKYKRHLVTAALPYANGPLHIGHIAGAYLPADTYVRFLRLKGEEVVFVCGSDEHGAAITIRAQKEGVTPQQIIDKYHVLMRDAFEKFGMSFDIYHRTSEQLHHETSQDFFKVMHERGEFEIQESEQYYDEEAGQFLADRYIIGTCPKCGHDKAYGDQCEKCGTSLSPLDLIHPKSTISGKTPVLRKTKHWYLPLNKHENWVREWLLNGVLKGKQHHDPKDWKHNVMGQCKSWLDGGLQPRAMTRDLDWGVKVPLPESEAKGKVLYVWLDAPIGYISATKQWAINNNKNWEDYWKSEDSRLVHFIGKDNIVFHCIIFPIILSCYPNFVLPENVPANEFLNLEGDKLSTSRNWAVWLHEYLEEFPDKQDVLRYVLNSISPETKDSEFTWKDFQARNNNELADIFGNFVKRVVDLTHRYFEGKIPALGELNLLDKEVIGKFAEIAQKVEEALWQYRFRDAQFEMMNLARLGNKYLADTEPWKLYKTNPKAVENIIHISLQLTANLAILAKPFLPNTAEKLEKMLNIKDLKWSEAGKTNLLNVNHAIGTSSVLFDKIEDAKIEAQIAKLQKSKVANQPAAPMKEITSFEDFQKMDIRIATILTAEKLKKSKKLLLLKVDTGIDQRTVVSGIGEYYQPEEVIGKQVTLLANLAPREIMGYRSEGMILMAEDKDGTLAFVSPDKKIANGGTVR